MKSAIAALRTLVLPFGTTSGLRIVLDGVNGQILVYDANNKLRVRLGTSGAVEVLSGDVDEILAGTMQASVQGVSGSTKVGVLTLESPSVDTSTGADLRAALELASESMNEGIAPYLNMIADAIRHNGREVGFGLVPDGIQRETTDDSARAPGANTDMVRTIVEQAGHWYRAAYSGNLLSVAATTGLSLTRNGSKIGLVDFLPAAGSFKSCGWVDYEATADATGVVLRLINDSTSGGNLTLDTNANEARVFSVVDLGNDTV